MTAFDRSLRSLEVDSWHRSTVTILIATGLLAALGGWLWRARLSLYEETADGRLEVLSAARPVVAEAEGRVIRNDMTVGQTVVAGEILVETDAEGARFAAEDHRRRIQDLAARGRALTEEVQSEERALSAHAIAGLSARREADARVSEATTRAALAGKVAERLALLAQHASVSDDELSRTRAEADAASAAAAAARFAEERVAGTLSVESADRATRISQLRRARLELDGVAQVETAILDSVGHEIERHFIRASTSGRLGEVHDLHAGSFVRAGDRLATIVPRLAELRVVALFPAGLVGRIRIGQRARLRLHSYPWTRYGTVGARVESVGTEPSAGLIRVELAVTPSGAGRLPLQHGLATDVEIEVETASPWALLLHVAGDRNRDQAAGRFDTAKSSK